MKWTIKDIKFIKANIHLTDGELATLLVRKKSQVCNARKRYGITKESNRGQFKKGLTVWNKGISYQAGGRSAETRFKKGQKPANAFRNYGDVFQIKDATGKYYCFIKLPHHRQYPYGRFVYEQHHNIKLTDNDVIAFKDKDTTNCDISNLECISRAELAKRNANRKKAAESMRKRKSGMLSFLKQFGITDKRKRA